MLPARFNPLVFPDEMDFSSFVPGYAAYALKSPTFIAVIPYLVASVIHHLSWLKTNLPDGHDFLTSAFYTQGFCTPGHNNSLVRNNGILLG